MRRSFGAVVSTCEAGGDKAPVSNGVTAPAGAAGALFAEGLGAVDGGSPAALSGAAPAISPRLGDSPEPAEIMEYMALRQSPGLMNHKPALPRIRSISPATGAIQRMPTRFLRMAPGAAALRVSMLRNSSLRTIRAASS